MFASHIFQFIKDKAAIIVCPCMSTRFIFDCHNSNYIILFFIKTLSPSLNITCPLDHLGLSCNLLKYLFDHLFHKIFTNFWSNCSLFSRFMEVSEISLGYPNKDDLTKKCASVRAVKSFESFKTGKKGLEFKMASV